MPNCKLILALSHARRSCGFECHHDEKDQAVAFQFISGRAGRTSFPLLSLTCWHQECTSLPGEFIVFFVFKRARQRCRSPESCLFFFLPLPFADLVSPAAGGMLLLCTCGFREEAQVVQKSMEANHSQRRPREALAANFVLLVVRSSGQARRHLHVGANPPAPCA